MTEGDERIAHLREAQRLAEAFGLRAHEVAARWRLCESKGLATSGVAADLVAIGVTRSEAMLGLLSPIPATFLPTPGTDRQ